MSAAPPPAVPPKLGVDQYLRNLRAVGETRFPYKDHPRGDVLDPAFAALTRSLADFVDAMRAHSTEGYPSARIAVLAIARSLPEPTVDADLEVRRLSAALSLMPSAPEPKRPAA